MFPRPSGSRRSRCRRVHQRLVIERAQRRRRRASIRRDLIDQPAGRRAHEALELEGLRQSISASTSSSTSTSTASCGSPSHCRASLTRRRSSARICSVVARGVFGPGNAPALISIAPVWLPRRKHASHRRRSPQPWRDLDLVRARCFAFACVVGGTVEPGTEVLDGDRSRTPAGSSLRAKDHTPGSTQPYNRDGPISLNIDR